MQHPNNPFDMTMYNNSMPNPEPNLEQPAPPQGVAPVPQPQAPAGEEPVMTMTPTVAADVPPPPPAPQVQEEPTNTKVKLDTSIQAIDASDVEYEKVPGDAAATTEQRVPDDSPTTDIDQIINEYNNENNERMDNTDQRNIAIPLSKIEDLDAVIEQELLANQGAARQALNDAASDLTAQLDAERTLSMPSFQQQQDAFSKVREHALKHSLKGIGDTRATVKSKFKDTDTLEVSGEEGNVIFSTLLTGGMRRIPLWNSGITVTLRPLTLDQLHRYYEEANRDGYEYGREFGAYYYMFANLLVSQHIFNSLLPAAICGSNYANWNNREALLRVISIQDYPTLLWAMAVMMHPYGAQVSFACGEKGCGHVTKENADLSKLRLINTDLVTPEMIDHFKMDRKVTDMDLLHYKEKMPFNRTLEFEYGQDGTTEYHHFKVTMKEPSLYEWSSVGNDFLRTLRRMVSETEQDQVRDYLFYNYFRAYRPWIHSIEMTTYLDFNGTYKKKTVTVTEDDNNATRDTFYNVLEEWRANPLAQEKVDKLFRDYIADTQISHICFYYPECPACHKPSSLARNGYIPYDPERNFFTLTLQKLLRAVSALGRTGTNS